MELSGTGNVFISLSNTSDPSVYLWYLSLFKQIDLNGTGNVFVNLSIKQVIPKCSSGPYTSVSFK